MHANTSKYLGIYFKSKSYQIHNLYKRSVVCTVFHQDYILFLLGIYFTGLNPYMSKHVWDTENAKFIMNLKLITILFLFEDLHFFMWNWLLKWNKCQNQKQKSFNYNGFLCHSPGRKWCISIKADSSKPPPPPPSPKGKRSFLVL